jgi:4-hydroxythreonine-4-phosphate dehydrogenase
MGDPAGIGPEIAAKLLGGSSPPPDCRIFVVGTPSVMKRGCRFAGVETPIHSMSSPVDLAAAAINVLPAGDLPAHPALGRVDAACGRASYDYLSAAIDLAQARSIDALVTNPINKESLKAAGLRYPGHTEILAEKTGTRTYTMMFVLEGVAVVHVTTHCSLREAIERIDSGRVLANIELLDGALKDMGHGRPRIAVGGLNPHAGENGLFGDEEIHHIRPAVEEARRGKGIDVTGPYPPDTVFMRAFGGEFDGVVSMLHDHGFVALKSRDFNRGVNITVGLPIIRTSVGHGTAYELAGTGKASSESLGEAIRMAVMMARGKARGGR